MVNCMKDDGTSTDTVPFNLGTYVLNVREQESYFLLHYARTQYTCHTVQKKSASIFCHVQIK